MDNYQAYVYTYKDPKGSIVYVGKGIKGRAWHTGYMRGDSAERQQWKEEQLNSGRLPCDWVDIIARNLDQDEAKELEQLLIEELKPCLNKLHNPDHNFSSVSSEEIEHWRTLRNEGISYNDIAGTSNYSTMTVWRALNG